MGNLGYYHKHIQSKLPQLKQNRQYPLTPPVAIISPLSANFPKWSNTLKQFVGKFPTNCLSVFDHFVALARKGLTSKSKSKIKTSNSPKLLLILKTFSILLKKKELWKINICDCNQVCGCLCEICIKSYLYEESPFNCAC